MKVSNEKINCCFLLFVDREYNIFVYVNIILQVPKSRKKDNMYKEYCLILANHNNVGFTTLRK